MDCYVRIFTAMVCCCFISKTEGQHFPASAIPDSLKKNADVVVRLEEKTFEIKSGGKMVVHERHVFTILNAKGEHRAVYRTRYNNKSVVINNVIGYLYDASGKEIRHFKTKDMEDLPAFDGVSFVTDEREKKGGFYSHSYPFTVDFEEEDEVRDIPSLGNWYPQQSHKYSVEATRFNIIAPKDYVIRYRMLNADLKPQITEEKGNKNYQWEVRNLCAYEDFSFDEDYFRYTPCLMLGLSDVSMENYKGSMNTWNDFAKFYGSMQKNRDAIPEEIKQKVHELTAAQKDPQSKIAVLYNYLQQNTHYVSIQLGIGGWQTYDANYVSKNKYGDCKALTNFMIALLKEAGIKANAVVIRGGPERAEFIKDFPHDPFNHVICCVPLDKDTVWLECTSQFLPPGYLSEFTSNRYGLLIGDDGGELVHTPAYLLADNVQLRKIAATLDGEGNLDISIHTSYKAWCQDRIEGMIHHNSKEEQIEILKSKFSLPTYDIVAINYTEDYSHRLPVIDESLHITVNNYAQITGKRIFINPNILTRTAGKMPEDNNRLFDFDLKNEFKYVDSIEINIPPGYKIESKLTDLDLKTNFGTYVNKTIVSGSKIFYYRKVEQFSGRFSADHYNELVRYSNKIHDADNTLIVLVKNESQ